MGLKDTLSTLREVIVNASNSLNTGNNIVKAHEPTPTEYFALLSTVLASSVSSQSMTVNYTLDLLRILIGVMDKTSKAVLRSQCKPLSAVLLAVIRKYQASPATEEIQVLQMGLRAQGLLMFYQESSDGFWNTVDALTAINVFLMFIDDARTSVRKEVHSQLSTLMLSHRNSKTGNQSNSPSTVRSYIADFCNGVMDACTRFDYNRALCVVLFLENYALISVPESHVVALVSNTIHKLRACEVPRLVVATYRMLDAFFQSMQYNLSARATADSLTILIAARAGTADMEATTHFCAAIASGVTCLHRMLLREHVAQGGSAKTLVSSTEAAAIDFTTLSWRAINAVAAVCECDFTQVYVAVGASIKRMISTLVNAKLLDAIDSSMSTPSGRILTGNVDAPGKIAKSIEQQYIEKMVKQIEPLLALKHKSAWMHILDSVRNLFDLCKGHMMAPVMLRKLSVDLVNIYEVIEANVIKVSPEVHLSLGETLGSALKSFGISSFLRVIPLFDVEAGGTDSQGIPSPSVLMAPDWSRQWLINILHSNLKQSRCTIADFGTNILPVAGACSRAFKAASKSSKSGYSPAQLKMVRNRILQLWSLLPDFCTNVPSDIPTSFPRLADILVNIFSDEDYPEAVPIAVNALSHLVSGLKKRDSARHASSPDSQEMLVLRGYSEVFIPLLLKYIETVDIGDGRFQVGIDCIREWISISPKSLVSKVAKRLLRLLLTTTQDLSSGSGAMTMEGEVDKDQEASAAASAWLAVMLAIIPCLSAVLIELLYKSIRPLLAVEASIALQKRAYAVLSALLTSHEAVVLGLESRLEIMQLVSESLLTCHVSSRNMRLRCLVTLMGRMEDAEELKAASGMILSEVLLCQRDANKKTRDGALEIFRIIMGGLGLQDLTVQLCSALVAETSIMRSAAVTALCILFVERRKDPNTWALSLQLLPTVSLLLQENSPDETKAVLAFIRVVSAIVPTEQIQPQLAELLLVVTKSLSMAMKAKFSSRCRAIIRKLAQRFDESVLRELTPESDMALLDYVLRQARRQDRKKACKKKGSMAQRMVGSDSENSDNDDDDGDDNDNDDDIQMGDQDEDGNAKGGSGGGNIMKVLNSNNIGLKRSRDRDDDDTATATATSNVIAQPSSVIGAATERADYRMDRRRVKATRASSAPSTSLPRTLNDLIEDDAPSNSGSGGGNSKAAPSSSGPADEDEDYSVVVAADGTVIVKEKAPVAAAEKAAGGKKRRIEAEAAASALAAATAVSKQESNEKRPDRRKRLNLKEPGLEYRSKKSGGDIWRKGQLEPHAFIPLDARLFTKKNRQESIDHFASVVKNRNATGKRHTQKKRGGGRK